MRADFGPARALVASDCSRPLVSAREVADAGAATGAHEHVGRNEYMVTWDRVTRREVLRAIHEYDRLGPEQFFSEHGFAPTATYELVWDERRYPPKAILGTAYEFATGQRLAPVTSRAGRSVP
jgi:hypothetical protein